MRQSSAFERLLRNFSETKFCLKHQVVGVWPRVGDIVELDRDLAHAFQDFHQLIPNSFFNRIDCPYF